MKSVTILLIAVSLSVAASGKSKITEDFIPVCDSLDRLITEKTSVESELTLKAVMKRGNLLDFYFDLSLSDIPWRYGDTEWFSSKLRELMPQQYRNYGIGRIYSAGIRMTELPVGGLGSDGSPDTHTYRIRKIPSASHPLVERMDGMSFDKGLDGRHIAVWPSHGLYFDRNSGRWQWQRPVLFQPVEDLLSAGFLIQYIVTMLENAGAYVMLARERDFNRTEIIVDNDKSPESEYRGSGTYSETGEWKEENPGFADVKAVYTGTENPFSLGSARSSACISKETERNRASKAIWTPDIPESGEYAVYISYKSLPNSTESAHYTVEHKGGSSEFIVNQKLGGGTWIYLGTFEFDEGSEGRVILDNLTPAGRRHVSGSRVSADAVKIGGGMGNIARKVGKDSCAVFETSMMPRYAEGARYWLQWAGADSTIYSQHDGENDYTDDLFSRGDWMNHLSLGSSVNPGKDGGKIPFDLVFALHTDAGMTPNDSTIGTLAIYTLKSEGKRKLPSGEDRHTNREYANLIQSQIVNDLRAEFDPEWNRRWIWNRGYRESRTPASPSMLCELLSHQNFADMRYGQDPAFRFCASRAVYKGILKYLSNRYGCEYVVQPLPVKAFSVNLSGGNAVLEWEERPDTLEPTANATGFLIQTRTDDGGFDNGMIFEGPAMENGRYRTEIPLEPGHVYSFRITAFNSGGKSFPSEILCAGIPSGHEQAADGQNAADSCVLIINNFDRVSAPAWLDSPDYAGFDNKTDGGVPYMKDISYTGEMYVFNRRMEWRSNDCPGFGASYNDMAGNVIAGNTFDYPYIHGKAVMDCGYPFCSSSSEAFVKDTALAEGKWCVDLICGKQVRTISGHGAYPEKYAVFPSGMRQALTDFATGGGSIIVSGANIGTDVWSGIYPIVRDSTERADEMEFAEKILGYRWITGHAGRTGTVNAVYNSRNFLSGMTDTLSYNNSFDSRLYRVENPDGIEPAASDAGTFARYSDTRISAGIYYDGGDYGTVCLGFPIEVIRNEKDIRSIFTAAFGFFRSLDQKTDENETD